MGSGIMIIIPLTALLHYHFTMNASSRDGAKKSIPQCKNDQCHFTVNSWLSIAVNSQKYAVIILQ